MAKYYLGLDEKDAKKKKRNTYIMQSDGTFKTEDTVRQENEARRSLLTASQFMKPLYPAPAITPTASKSVFQPGSPLYPTPMKQTIGKGVVTEEEARKTAEENVQKKYGTYEQFLQNGQGQKKSSNPFAEKNKKMAGKAAYDQLILEETKRLMSDSNFFGLTNDTYQQYLDNLEKNAKEQKQFDWLKEQKKNLEAMSLDNAGKKYEGKNTREWVEEYVKQSKNPLNYMQKYDAEHALEELGYSEKEIKSMADTCKREQNAKRNEDQIKWADELQDGSFSGSLLAQALRLGAGFTSAPGFLAGGMNAIKEAVTGEYSPLDTNEYTFAAGDFRDRVSQNSVQNLTHADEYAEKGEKAPLWRKGLGWIYQGGSSFLESQMLNMAIPGGALAVMGAEAFAGSSKDAFERTGNNLKAMATGATSGGIEVLTENTGLDNIWDIMQGSGKAAMRSSLANLLAQSTIEGVEELSSEGLNTFTDWIINRADSNLERNVQSYKAEGLSEKKAWGAAILDAVKQAGEAGLVGALSGAMGGGMATAMNPNTNGKAGLTQNEQKVVDVVTEQRISEAESNGKELTSRERSAIKKEVEGELRSGRIGIDTIEEALGGDTYNQYRTANDQEELLVKEFNTLNRMKQGEMTGEQMDRRTELKQQLEELKKADTKTKLKERLSKEVSDMTLNDRYLRESYNEKGRRSQEFAADVSKYHAKQQETIQKAIDSKILNNTNRTHEFVDMIAKISADKGVSFDFTNNEKLKESGFVLEGKRINGFVKDGNVTLNIESAKALGSVVGHEITHVLEGTEHYSALAEAVRAYAETKGEYQSRYDALTKLYENVEGANIENELTADLIGDYLFADEKFVQQLSAKNQNLFQKIFHEIKYLVKTATAGSKEEKQLLKVKKLFEEAYKENISNNAITDKVQYSLTGVDKNGIEVYETSEEVKGLSYAQRKAKLLDAMKHEYAGRTAKFTKNGQVYYAQYDEKGVRKGIYGDKKSDKKGFNTKINIGADGNYIELAENALYTGTSAEKGKTNDFHRDAKNWDYYLKTIKSDGEYYNVLINVKDTGSEHYVYDITLTKTEQATTRTNLLNRSELAPINSISQSQQNATGKIQHSLSDENGSITPIDSRLTYGRDIALEKIAPAQQKVQTNANTDQTSQVRQLAPLPEKLAEASTDNHPFAPITTVKQRNDAKRENLRMELRRIEEARETTDNLFAEKIQSKREEYNGKKDKTTKVAQDLLRQINEMERKRKDALATSEKKIHDLEGQLTKMSSEEFKTAEQRQMKQEGYRTMWEKLLGDISTWKDKKLGIQYQMNTLKRNLRDIVKDADGKQDLKKADAIYEETQGKYNRNEAKLNREANRIKEYFRRLKINSKEDVYIQMLGEYKYNPDCEITPDVIHEFYEKNKKRIDTEKVDKVIEEVRELYDSLYERVNEVLEEQGMRKIGYREGYFPHFTEDKQGWLGKLLNWKTQNNDIPTDIAGLTQNFKPNRSWQSFDKRRTSDSTDYSFKKGLDTYVNGALDWIYHIEDIQKRRALEDVIRYQHSDTGIREQIEKIRASEELDADQMQEQIDLVYKKANNPLNNFVQDLRRGTDTLAGKKALGDRILEGKVNRKVYSVMTNVSNRVSANMVAGSVSSALTNFIPIVQSWSLVNPVSSIKAMKDTIKNYVVDDGTIGMSDFLVNRLQQSENLYQTNWDKAGHVVGFMMDTVDNFTSQVVWRSKYSENIKNGMSVEDAVHNADNFAEGLMAGRSRGNMPTIFNEKNPMTKLFTVFQLEVANQYQYMFKDMPQETKLENVSMKRLVGGYAAMFIGSYAYNALYSKLFGRNAAFDPIRIIEELIRGLTDDEDEKDEKDVLLEFGENAIQELPFVGGLFGGGRIPISSALPFSSAASPVEGVGEFADAVSNENWKKVTEELLNPVFYIAMPMGGGQMRKTWKGLSMFDKDLPVSGSYTNSGKLRFPVADTAKNRAQAAVFGQYANENARDYFAGGYQPLNDKQIEEFKALDIPIQEYWKIRSGMKGLKKAEEKAEYIAGLDLPVEKKNILINNALNRKKKIDLADYDEFESWKAFDEFMKKQNR